MVAAHAPASPQPVAVMGAEDELLPPPAAVDVVVVEVDVFPPCVLFDPVVVWLLLLVVLLPLLPPLVELWLLLLLDVPPLLLLSSPLLLPKPGGDAGEQAPATQTAAPSDPNVAHETRRRFITILQRPDQGDAFWPAADLRSMHIVHARAARQEKPGMTHRGHRVVRPRAVPLRHP
jgi:hypothetical protein